MPYDHVIAAGDHLVRLAYLQGIRDPLLVWGDPANAALRKQRPDPGVLGVGDIVHVPDGPPWLFESLETGREHTVIVDLAVAVVRVRLRHPGGGPRAGKPCTVVVDTGTETGIETKRFETDSDGLVEVEIGPFTTTMDLEIDEERYRLAIARLEPGETLAGVRQRLFNLGYDPGPQMGKPDNYLLRMAVEEFQHDNGLDADGVPGGKTQKKLVEIHGA